MSSETKWTKGEWKIVENKGEFGWPAGFYVYRDIATPSGKGVEWMKQRGGIRPFLSESSARTALASARGEG